MYDNRFENDIAKVKELGALYSYLFKTIQHHDLSDILRAQLVFAVSAFDKLLHEILLELILSIFQKEKPAIQSYYDFIEGMDHKFLFHYDENNFKQFEKYIQSKLSKESLQQPHKIREIFGKFYKSTGPNGIWDEVASQANLEVNTLLNTLKLISERRNKIVHESDSQLDSINKTPIDSAVINQNIDFIEQIGTAFISIFARSK